MEVKELKVPSQRVFYSRRLVESLPGSHILDMPGIHRDPCVLKPLQARYEGYGKSRDSQTLKMSSLSSFGQLYLLRRKLYQYETAINGLNLRKTVRQCTDCLGFERPLVEHGKDKVIALRLFGILLKFTRARDVDAVESAKLARAKAIKERDDQSKSREIQIGNLERQVAQYAATVQKRESLLSGREAAVAYRESSSTRKEWDLRRREQDLWRRGNEVTEWERRQEPMRHELGERERGVSSRESAVRNLERKQQAIRDELFGRERHVAGREQNIEAKTGEVEAMKQKLQEEKTQWIREKACGRGGAMDSRPREKLKIN